jgi:hypothetical protein
MLDRASRPVFCRHGLCHHKDSFIQIPRHTAALPEQREAERVGRHLQNRIGQYITGVQRSVTTMASNGDLELGL